MMQNANEQSSQIARRSAGAGSGGAFFSTSEESFTWPFCVSSILMGRPEALTFALAGP